MTGKPVKFKPMLPHSRAIMRQGRVYLEGNPNQRFASTAQWLWSLLFLCCLLASYAGLLALPVGAGSLLLCILTGIFTYMVIAAFCHDAAHGSLSRHPLVNSVFLYIGFALIGVNGQLWKYRHLNKHHPYPNVKGNDVDADASLLIRLSPSNPWRKPHRFQAIYAPLLYGLVLQSVTWYEDFTYFKKARREKPKHYGTRAMLALFVGSKLIHVALFILIPLLVMNVSFFEWLLGYMIVTSTASFIFIMVNVGSHITDACTFSEADEEGGINHDWVTHQLVTSVDWSPANKFFIALTGGANAHAAHHLFPNAAHCHNADLTRIVRNNLPPQKMRNELSFSGMLAAHWRLLCKLSYPTLKETP